MVLKISIDVKSAVAKLDLLEKKVKGPVTRISLDRIGARYVKFLKNRYRSVSAGSGAKGEGGWDKLKDSTIARKKRRGVATGNLAWILREGNVLLNSISYLRSRRQVIVGYVFPKKHPRSNKTTAQLAAIHARGGKNLPKRPIIASPNLKVRREFVRIIENELDHATNSTDNR